MVVRRHGVIGGPKQSPPKSRKIKKPLKVKKNSIEIMIIKDEEFIEEPVMDVIVVESNYDVVTDEDKLESYIPNDLDVLPRYGCIFCEFAAKSKRGLKTHKRAKHPVTEDFEPELEE